MINVSISAVSESSQKLKKHRTAILEQCDKISSALTSLSRYSDFDRQLKKLYEIKKNLEEDAFMIFCLGRVLELSADCYKKTENKVTEILENEQTRKKAVVISEHRYSPNPEFINIV